MKKTKHILNKVNLVLFLAYFVLLTFNSFSMSRSMQSRDHVPQHLTSKQAVISDSSQQLSEENETEKESDFELQALTLPFSVSYFTFEIAQPAVPSAEPLTDNTHHPIYVAVRNFRI